MFRKRMVRKAAAFILCFCMMILAFIPSREVKAQEYEKKYLTIKRLNDGQQDTYEILTDGENVYIGASDLKELSGFDTLSVGREDGELVSILFFKEEGNQKYPRNVFIAAQTQKIQSLQYGMRQFDAPLCVDMQDEVYLNLVDMFNYLRIKASIAEDRLLVNMPVYTMYDFMADDYPVAMQNMVTQLDLLEPGESLLSSSLKDAIALACNEFDFRFLIPIWGANKIKDEQYMEAIQTLNEEDEKFYTENTKEFFKSELEKRGLKNCPASGEDLASFLTAGEDTIENVDDIINQIEGLSKAYQEALLSYWDTVNWTREDFLEATGLKTFSEHAEKVSGALALADLAVSAYETYKRASNWSEGCVEDLDVLRSLDVNNYANHRDYIERIKKVAEQGYQERLDPGGAAAEQVGDSAFDYILEKVITDTSVYGKVADLFVFVVNTGVGVARCFGNLSEKMDKGDLSYMVSGLINIAAASRIDAEVKYDSIALTALDSGNDVDDFRNSMRTTLKSNLRCWSYIYYLNSDGEWEKSAAGEDVKAQIDKMHVYLTLLDETEQYDYALDEYDVITCSPREIAEICTESKIFEDMQGEFIFSSGAGAWRTIININSDGSFSGKYTDSNIGDRGIDYPNGTTYICDFTGSFYQPKQIDEFTYSMTLNQLEMEGEVGEVYYENGTKYIRTEPYGFDDAEEFIIYSPGIAISELPEEFLPWLSGFIDVTSTETLPCYGIYNVNGKTGFVGY